MECEEENVDKRVRDGILSVIEDMKRIDYIKPEDVPNIDLYMDQVTTFMDKHLETTRRYNCFFIYTSKLNMLIRAKSCKSLRSDASLTPSKLFLVPEQKEIFKRSYVYVDFYLLS